ncbi:hypothetical protein D3C81_839260 [compost metagenome]
MNLDRHPAGISVPKLRPSLRVSRVRIHMNNVAAHDTVSLDLKPKYLLDPPIVDLQRYDCQDTVGTPEHQMFLVWPQTGHLELEPIPREKGDLRAERRAVAAQEFGHVASTMREEAAIVQALEYTRKS